MRAVVGVLVVALVGCVGPGAAGGDDELRRTVVGFEVGSRGMLEMDLRADPPVLQPGYDDPSSTVPVTDLDAARELRDRLLDLPSSDPACPLTVEPTVAARVAVYPRPEDAEFADLAVVEVGGPCAEVSDAVLVELVELWNSAGGSIDPGPGS